MPAEYEKELVELETAYMEQTYAQRERRGVRHVLSHEQEILLAVERGDPAWAEEQTNTYCPRGEGSEERKNMEEQRAICIYVATLSAWAAIRGGVREEEAFAFLNVLLRRLDRMKAVEDIVTMKRTVAAEFARFTQIHGKKKEGRLVRQAKTYIGDHLHQPLRVKELAAKLGVRQGVLSAEFRKTEGCTVTQYINREKLKEAKYLLVYTQREIADISAVLGYQSQSHFGEVFRNGTGMTPKKYRDTYDKVRIFDKIE